MMLDVQVNLPDHVTQGMVLLVDGEDGSVGNLGVLLSRDLLLSVKQQKRLERWWSVHFVCKKIETSSINPLSRPSVFSWYNFAP